MHTPHSFALILLCAFQSSAAYLQSPSLLSLVAPNKGEGRLVMQGKRFNVVKAKITMDALQQISRRTVINACLTSCALGVSSQLPKVSSAEVYEYANYNQDGKMDVVFRLDVPKEFFKTKRPLKTGTIFVAGSLRTAEIVSVEVVSVEQLLADVGVLPTGDLSTWQSIGNPKKIAELLAARRDGDAKQQGGLPSKVDPNSVKQNGTTLSFLAITPIAVQRPDKLLEAQGIAELRRITQARAELRGDGSMVVLWASALEQDWLQGAASSLSAVANSLQLVGAAAPK